jgi:hypothetical protein
MMLGVAKAPHFAGPYEVITPEPIFGGPGKPAVEDPFIFRSARGIELLAKDMTGAYCGEAGGGIHAFSPDGLNWRLSDRPQSWSRTLTLTDDRRVTFGSAERPFILFEDGKPTHLFLSMADGPGGFANISETWVQPIRIKAS